jgi:hypothetical protein
VNRIQARRALDVTPFFICARAVITHCRALPLIKADFIVINVVAVHAHEFPVSSFLGTREDCMDPITTFNTKVPIILQPGIATLISHC